MVSGLRMISAANGFTARNAIRPPGRPVARTLTVVLPVGHDRCRPATVFSRVPNWRVTRDLGCQSA